MSSVIVGLRKLKPAAKAVKVTCFSSCSRH